MFVNPKVIDAFKSEFVLAQINGKKDTATSHVYHVPGYPTIVLEDSAGSEIDRIVGYLPPDEFLQTLRDYTKGIGTLSDLLSQAETSEDRELYYRIGKKYDYRGGISEALSWFNRVIDMGEPTDSLSGKARFDIADLYLRTGEYDLSLDGFKAIADDFGTGNLVESAEIYIPIVYVAKDDTTAAIEAFRNFVEKYPESEDADYAEKRIEELMNPQPTEQ